MKTKNYTAIALGPWDNIASHTIVHPKTGEQLHKVFLKSRLGLSGSEISFQSLGPHEELPYFHIHRKNEEVYVVIKGRGKFQVDGDCFDVTEGSVVKVDPEGRRGLANCSDSEMIYMVIQTRKDSLEKYSAADAELAVQERLWRFLAEAEVGL